MRRWIPYPWLALVLWGLWLLLTQSLTPGQLLLGAAVAVLATRAMAALEPERFSARSLRAAAELAVLVPVDIVRSNFAVARIVLFPRRRRTPGFIRVPLELRSRPGLALFALIITATPGTLWVDLDRARGVLLVHVLDLDDEDAWIRLLKERYESRLREIFEA